MHSDLIAKLEALDGPSRDVGYEVISRLISVDDPDAKAFYGSGKDITASLDATIALVERALPGWEWLKPAWNEMAVYRHGDGDTEAVEYASDHPVAAIALLIAALKALEARDG